MSKIVTSNLEASASYLNLLSTFKGGPLGVSPFEGGASLSIATSSISFSYIITAPSGFISWKGTGTNLQFDDLNRPIAGTITSFSQSNSFDTAGGPAQTNSFELTDVVIDASTVKSGNFGDIVFAENNDVTLEFLPSGPFTQNSSVQTGSGDDTVRLVSEFENFMIGNVGATIDMGAGNDTVEISSQYPTNAFTRITTGSGKDNIIIDFDADNTAPVSLDFPNMARLVTVTDFNPNLDRISLTSFPEGASEWSWVILESGGSAEVWAVNDEDSSGTYDLVGIRIRLEGIKEGEVKIMEDSIIGVGIADQINVINGTSGDDFLFGTDGDDLVNLGDGVDVMNGSAGDDIINGGGGAYNQIDYDGKPSDYTFTKNDDGSIRVEKPDGTDTLTDIHGIWFKDDQWYKIEDLIEPNGPNIIETSPGNYTLRGTDQDDIFILHEAKGTVYGSEGFDIVRIPGAPEDYDFYPGKGVFALVGQNGNRINNIIDGGQANEKFVFEGTGQAFTQFQIGDYYAENNPNLINGTTGDDFLFGTDGDDLVNLGDGIDVMNGSAGDDIINGGSGAYNQIDYDGKPSDYVFTKNDDGSIRVEKPDGTDILTDIHGIWFKDDQWYKIEDLINNDNPPVNVINGTPGDDFLFGTDSDDIINLGGGIDVANGSAGNDIINGGTGAYNQVDYDGIPTDYTFTKNDDGSIRVEKSDGTDTLTNIHGIWFKDDQWYKIEDLFEENFDTVSVASSDY